jgi:uncharacterized protein YbbC (DUF1343 family)
VNALKVGAENTEKYFHLLKDKNIGCVVNHTSKIKTTHLVDSLLNAKIIIAKIFSPEHGLKGTADAGEHVSNDVYKNIPIISLYGDNKKPKADQLKGIDIMIFDMQDVGVRFYTYISTLHYVMESCAELNIPLIILDRPNPHAHYVDGPMLKEGYESFIGMHKVPVCYGMTIGEYGTMINDEGWLSNRIKCQLIVIKIENYKRDSLYELPIKPSPNLPNKTAVQLYPSICFFEGTVLSLGRGTDKQFQVVGHPSIKSDYSFKPMPNEGAKDPVLNGKVCYGRDYSGINVNDFHRQGKLDLSILLHFYKIYQDKNNYFLKNNFFDKLAGSDELRNQIINQLSEEEIRKSWKPYLEQFKLIRKKYLLYE